MLNRPPRRPSTSLIPAVSNKLGPVATTGLALVGAVVVGSLAVGLVVGAAVGIAKLLFVPALVGGAILVFARRIFRR